LVTQVGWPAFFAAFTIASDYLEGQKIRPSARPLPNVLKASLTLVLAQVSQLPGQE